MAQTSPLINVMVAAAQKAGRKLTRDFGEVEHLQVSRKGPGDFVSNADRKAERTIYKELLHARPGYGFLMEEAGVVEGSDTSNRWIIDPLDGTTNFLHGIPHFAISIALERDGEIHAGVVYEPITDQIFWAEVGKGAFLNNRRLRVSARREMADSIFATGVPFIGSSEAQQKDALNELHVMMKFTSGVRRFGAASLDLAWVAAGRYEGFWEAGLKPWDMAAGIIMVKEAGGYVSDFANGKTMMESGNIVAGNDQLHVPLVNLLKKARKSA